MEENELELPCTSVNEVFFGSALADCVLVPDDPVTGGISCLI